MRKENPATDQQGRVIPTPHGFVQRRHSLPGPEIQVGSAVPERFDHLGAELQLGRRRQGTLWKDTGMREIHGMSATSVETSPRGIPAGSAHRDLRGSLGSAPLGWEHRGGQMWELLPSRCSRGSPEQREWELDGKFWD